VATALASCSSEYDVKDGGATAATPLDGADSTGDGSQNQVSTGDAGPSANGSFCAVSAAGAVACTTFDESLDFPKGWTKDIKSGGSLTVNAGANTSPPNALEATTPQHTTTVNPYQFLQFSLPQGSGKFAVEFDFRATVDLANTDDSGKTAYLCVFEVYSDNAPNAQICFGKHYMGATIETYDQDASATPGSAHVTLLTTPPELDVWHHVHAEFSFLPSGGAISVKMDGQSLGTTAPARTVEPTRPSGGVTVEVGADSNGNFGQANIRFDNVAVWFL
jgi:hypothetical protein